MRFFNTTQFVHEILKKFPETRDDDYLLWLKVIENVANYNNTPDFSKTLTVGEFLKIARYSIFPHYETVGRARRKLQRKYPELRASEETQAAREEMEELYREYAKTDVGV